MVLDHAAQEQRGRIVAGGVLEVVHVGLSHHPAAHPAVVPAHGRCARGAPSVEPGTHLDDLGDLGVLDPLGEVKNLGLLPDLASIRSLISMACR